MIQSKYCLPLMHNMFGENSVIYINMTIVEFTFTHITLISCPEISHKAIPTADCFLLFAAKRFYFSEDDWLMIRNHELNIYLLFLDIPFSIPYYSFSLLFIHSRMKSYNYQSFIIGYLGDHRAIFSLDSICLKMVLDENKWLSSFFFK